MKRGDHVGDSSATSGSRQSDNPEGLVVVEGQASSDCQTGDAILPPRSRLGRKVTGAAICVAAGLGDSHRTGWTACTKFLPRRLRQGNFCAYKEYLDIFEYTTKSSNTE